MLVLDITIKNASMAGDRERLAATLTGVLTTEASFGSAVPFDSRIQRLRPHPGQIDVAAALRALLNGR